MTRKITKKWEMKGGTKIRICDMQDSHLINTINMVERNAKYICNAEMEACMSLDFQGEMAQMHQDQFLATASYEMFLPEIYYSLLEERDRRNI